MPMAKRLFTSESVTEGHPDKICDQISDTLLDAILEQDPLARVAIETMVTTGLVHVAGELTTTAYVEMPKIIREKIIEIGYTSSDIGFDGSSCGVSMSIGQQSPDIAQGVDAGLELREQKSSDPYDMQGAGDQGIMFGYATTETPELMPAPIQYSHAILRRLAEARKDGSAPDLGPDAKSQLSLRYENGKPVEIMSIVLSTQHRSEDQDSAYIRSIVEPYIREVVPAEWLTANTEWWVNPTGTFVIGGPDGDAGLTGRKIIVDTYGGAAPHGGGAFSGKDPTKVDRSAAYAARYLAKNIVAAGMAERCSLQLSYAIGVSKPLSIYVDTYGTGQLAEEAIERAVAQSMDLTPRGIREHLGLNKPIYQRTAAYGHFGRAPEADGGFSWEKTDLVEALKKAV